MRCKKVHRTQAFKIRFVERKSCVSTMVLEALC
ncbi:hypothetical protein CsSME_00002755 [Camellia sinensis var. sinensis]